MGVPGPGRQGASVSNGVEAEEPGNALPALRHNRLLQVLQERGQVTVNELVALFGVSRDTIRRDLDQLERHGLLQRTHGGAVNNDRLVRPDTTLGRRMDERADEKRRIATAAARLIRNEETMVLNGGSSVYHFAAALGDLRDLTIVTNNLRVPPAIPEGSVRAIHILGGTYLPGFQVTIGPVGFAPLAGMHVDTAVIGCTGISASGVSMTKLDEAAHTAAMIGMARRTIVLADQSKFNVSVFGGAAALNQIAWLVTDAPPPAELAVALHKARVEVLIAPP